MTTLREAIEGAAKGAAVMQKELDTAKNAVRNLEHSVAERDAVIKMLEGQLAEAKTRGDHYLRWNTELIKACNTIQNVINGELASARGEIQKFLRKSNGPQVLLDQLEKDMVGDQPQGTRDLLSDDRRTEDR